MLEHGGQLLRAVERYGVPREQWLDLSTGINPVAWAGAPVAIEAWNRLPEDNDGLIEAANAYYNAAQVLPVCGSQAAIQALPRLRSRSRVGVASLGYNEHGYRWKQAGHEVIPVEFADLPASLAMLDVLVVCNPNNPTGQRVTPAELLEWHAHLASRGGWLVVDEAFADSTPESSVAQLAHRAGLIVLRSLGKFFGLAGARLGFVVASGMLLNALSEWLGPWTIAGPSRVVARAALEDRKWQEATRIRLRNDSQRLAASLGRVGLRPAGGCDLFQWIRSPRALELHEALARRGILTRHFGAVPSLRFGLPGSTEQWDRLQDVLDDLVSSEVEL